MYYEHDAAKEGVEEMNARLKKFWEQRGRTRTWDEKKGFRGKVVENEFSRGENTRCTSFDEADNYVRCARKRRLESCFSCDNEECVKRVKRNPIEDSHSTDCKMNDSRYLVSDDFHCLSLPVNKKDIREEFHKEMDRLISGRNMWGMLWAEELYRLRCVDVKAYAYQSGVLSCDWYKEYSSESKATLMDNAVKERSSCLRERLVDRGLRALDHEMKVAVKIVNKELVERGAQRQDLRNRRMPLQAFHNIIRSSESMNDRYLWQNQLIKIYDVKHGWMRDKLPTRMKEVLDQDCPEFDPETSSVCRFCDIDRWDSRDPPQPCKDWCNLCHTMSANSNRRRFWTIAESHPQDSYIGWSGNSDLELHPSDEHLIQEYRQPSVRIGSWFVSAQGLCRHQRYSRCGCYRPKIADLPNVPESAPYVALHNYNYGWGMDFQLYSSQAGIGNTPVRFTGELVRPFETYMSSKEEVTILKDRLTVNGPGWLRGNWERWSEATKHGDSYPHWNPAVDWNAHGPRLIGRGYHELYTREDYYKYLPTKRRNSYVSSVSNNLDIVTRDTDAYIDYPQWIDNTDFWAWKSPYDDKPQDENNEPIPIKWIEDGVAVLKGQMCLLTPMNNIRENYPFGRGYTDRNALNGYNPLNHTGTRHLMVYLNSMTSQLREILSINAMYRNHFGMSIKQMYYGALHQESKIMRHYAQMSNPTIAAVIEAQKLGVGTIQRINFLREQREYERIFKTPIGTTSFMNVVRARIPNYIIIEELIKILKESFNQITTAPYEMPNHPSCQIVSKKAILNTEKLILHMAYINNDDMKYFYTCYARIYRCKCFL